MKKCPMPPFPSGTRNPGQPFKPLTDINGQTAQRLAAFGLNLNDPNARSLLTSTFASGKPQAAGFQVPYAGFPLTQTLAQALRPFPQFSNIPVLWSPRGNNWYDSMQAKATQRLKHGLNSQVSFTWQKELTDAENTGGNDIFNLPVRKAISGSSIPLELAISFNYQFPARPDCGAPDVVRVLRESARH